MLDAAPALTPDSLPVGMLLLGPEGDLRLANGLALARLAIRGPATERGSEQIIFRAQQA